MWCPEEFIAALAEIAQRKVPEKLVKRLGLLASFAILCVGIGITVVGIGLPLMEQFKAKYEYMNFDLNLPRMVFCGGMVLTGIFFAGVGAFGCFTMLKAKLTLLILYGRFLFVISSAKAGGAVCVLGGMAMGLGAYFFYTSPENIKYFIEILISYFIMMCAVAVLVFAGIEFAASMLSLYLSYLIKEREGGR